MKAKHRTPRTRVLRCPTHWTAEQRLAHFTKLDPLSGCLIWQGCINRAGYGQLNFKGLTQLAHRWAWKIKHGSIPSGMHICHRCDERRCINADHLFLGTHATNMADLQAKKRRWYGGAGQEDRGLLCDASAAELAPIRILYRGIEFMGHAVARPIDCAVQLPALVPARPDGRAQTAPSRRRAARRRPPRRTGARAVRG